MNDWIRRSVLARRRTAMSAAGDDLSERCSAWQQAAFQSLRQGLLICRRDPPDLPRRIPACADSLCLGPAGVRYAEFDPHCLIISGATLPAIMPDKSRCHDGIVKRA